MIGIVITE